MLARMKIHLSWEDQDVCTYMLCVFTAIPLSFTRTELLRRIKRYQVANHSCMVIKYEKDNRYDADGVATHDK